MQCSISINTDSTITIWRGDMDTVLVTSETALTGDTWYKLGLQGSVDHSGGELEVLVDGEVFVRINNVDTAQETSNTWRGIYVGFSNDWTLGHLYVVDGSGSQTSLIPGAYVKHLTPNADGTYTGWTAIGAASPFAAVDESDPDDDTTRILAPTVVGTRYTLQLSTLATTQAIYGVQSSAMVRNVENSGMSPSHELVMISGGNVHVDTWQSMANDEWRVPYVMWDRDPTTENPWTVATVNAAEPGGQLQA
jgi:hypothetical protein